MEASAIFNMNTKCNNNIPLSNQLLKEVAF